MKSQIALLALAALAGAINGSSPRVYDQLLVQDFQQNNFTQVLDHFNFFDKRNFTQRYWVNDKYWDNKTGPIFLYICGESTCRPPTERAYAFQICQEVNCLFYVVEHRYYGASQPFSNWTVENLKYLNSTQALADLDYFIKSKNIEIENQYGSGIHKWLTIGGSYPGALSAWFKSLYNSADAAWSSSGVINVIQNYSMYDFDLFQASERSGDQCVNVIRNVTNYIEQSITGKLTPDDKYYVYQVFGGRDLPPADFMNYIADAVAGAIQYGKREAMCNVFNSIAFAPVKQQLPVFDQFAIQSDGDIGSYNREFLRNVTYDINNNQRQWSWQVCTEFGWFQIPNNDEPMRSGLLGPDFWLQWCKDIFDPTVGPPAVDWYNKYYGSVNITGENIIFVNAIEDPWQYAGMRELTPDQTQSGMRNVLINCNNCAHCVDLRTPSDVDAPPLTNARNYIKKTVTGWLAPTQADYEKAFGKNSTTTDTMEVFDYNPLFLQE